VFVNGSDQLMGRVTIQITQELQVKITFVAMNQNLKRRVHELFLRKEGLTAPSVLVKWTATAPRYLDPLWGNPNIFRVQKPLLHPALLPSSMPVVTASAAEHQQQYENENDRPSTHGFSPLEFQFDQWGSSLLHPHGGTNPSCIRSLGQLPRFSARIFSRVMAKDHANRFCKWPASDHGRAGC
jgi:hypothetical protein